MLQHQIRQQDGRIYEFGAVNNVSLETISKHLSKICRFAGATCKFYSVAQHCWLVEEMMWEDNQHPASLRLKAALHDAHEAFITDIPTPLATYLQDKVGTPFLHELKDMIDIDIFRSLGVELPTDEEKKIIKYYDHQAFCIEARRLIKNPPPCVYDKDIREKTIFAWVPAAAERSFYNRVRALEREINEYGPNHGAVA